MKKTKPVLYDPLIINRVKQYLEENVDKTYLDVGVMTKQLQERYPEYSRRKVAPFRALVEQAYHVVSQSYGLNDTNGSGDESDASDLEVMDINEKDVGVFKFANTLPTDPSFSKLLSKNTDGQMMHHLMGIADMNSHQSFYQVCGTQQDGQMMHHLMGITDENMYFHQFIKGSGKNRM